MAIMIDKKPEYKGEGLVWESLSKNLPNDVVVYSNREVVNGDECDFALLIKDRGILIIEVKGWLAKYVFEVTNDGHVILTNDSPDEKKTQGSPRIQARKYRFQWLNYIQDRLGFSPLVLHMVCYPFITEKEYHEVKLDVLSDRDITLFAEDIKNPVKLGQKIDSWFRAKKSVSAAEFDNAHMALVRQCFEPSFQPKEKELHKISNGYSYLALYGHDLKDEDENELIEAYFAGTKVIAFVHHQKEVCDLSEKLRKGLNERNLVAEHGNIRLAGPEEEQGELWSPEQTTLRIFNFEIYQIADQYVSDRDIFVEEGNIQQADEGIFRRLDSSTDFNYKQYCVEHADKNTNILVRAGAGTGKTFSMVSRIAYLCNTRNNAVYNLVDDIAMVTFTNDAADNMKTRLKRAFMNYFLLTGNKRFLTDIESVDLMQISTIHKFAKSIIQSSSVEYGLGHDFSITSSVYAKEQIYEKYLDAYLIRKQETDPSFDRKLRMPVHKFRRLLMNFSKQLYDKSCDIKTIAAEELGTFDELPFFNEVILEVIIPAEKEYNESVTAKNKIDLKESMILLNDAVGGVYRYKCNLKYRYLFIDEFQDTDDVQIDSFLKLQKIIAGMKLFIVGDIKQSIYRFRGATDSAFDRIKTKNDQWKEFSLTTNYRSDKRLLDAFDKVFSRMGRNAYLKFEPGQDTLDSTIITGIDDSLLIQTAEYSGDTDGARLDALFQKVQEQIDLIVSLEERGKLSDQEKIIAVLVRENWQIEEILEESRRRGIYIETEIGGDLYQLSPALDLYKLILALRSPHDPVVLYNLISSNYVDIEIDIQGLQGLNKSEKAEILTEALNQFLNANSGLSWEEIIKDIKVKPILVLLRNLYESLQPWQRYSDDETGQKFYKANYELVLEKIIKAYSVDYLTLNVMENSLRINILTGQEELSRTVAGLSSGVRVICKTVHKSKGLEFGTVIIPYADADISTLNKSPLDVVYSDHKLAYGMKLDGSARYYNSNYDTRTEKSQRIQEESRVFYVALTRAIRNVVILKNTASKSPISWQKLMEE